MHNKSAATYTQYASYFKLSYKYVIYIKVFAFPIYRKKKYIINQDLVVFFVIVKINFGGVEKDIGIEK